jgi:hypothetical protein
MTTPNAPITPARPAGPRAWAIASALLAAVALAGCGTSHAGSPSGGVTPTASATTASAAPSGSGGSAAPSGSAAPTVSSGSATPVPTVSGGPVVGGEPACVGWPSHAPTASLPVSFVPVSVERCVSGAQTVPGKGLWSTASLQRADSGLAALISALHQPPAGHVPGTVCPALAMIPPQVVLISATGQELIPRLPVSGCGLVQSQVLAALDTLPWRLVSVRLIAPIPGASSSGTVP